MSGPKVCALLAVLASQAEAAVDPLPNWDPFWYYQGPFPSLLFDVSPKSAVQADQTLFHFSGYLAEEGVPVVFLRSPEKGARNYNICAELLPNEEWAVENMNAIGPTRGMTETLNNGTQTFDVVIEYAQREALVVDTTTLESNQVGDWTTQDAVDYYVCVRPDDNGWNSLDSLVTVKQENASDPFYGYQSCDQLLAVHPEYCGCFFSVGDYTEGDAMAPYVNERKSGWINIDTAYQMQLMLDIDIRARFRMGCCADLPFDSRTLTEGATPVSSVLSSDGTWLRRNWGTCKPADQAFSPRPIY
ncbi:hypothetical protein DIPPA_24021 [Diplonema papillatum]|nr:hypothetical protein DIPPA_24021 [Diplonema papillatum]